MFETMQELFKILNIFFGYENYSFDFDNLDSDLWTLGAGVHFSVLRKLDLTGDEPAVLIEFERDGAGA